MNNIESLIKNLILEELNEGRRERDWIAQQPEELRQAYSDGERQGLKIPHLAWIKKVRGGEPIEDVVPDVVEFLDDSNQQKLSDNGFETQLSTKTYPSVNDLRMLIQKIEDAEESDIQYDNILKDPSQVQLIGKAGKWEVLMPVTQKGSIACDISGKDTTWCTQKRSGQNLFYSYVARHGQDIILFYVMDYTRTPDLQAEKNADARLSIGFVNGKPLLDGQSGSVSVNSLNKGLTPEYLQSALGENYNEIMSLMTSKAEEVGGKHPAKEQMKKAATNLFYLKKLVKDLGEREKEDFLKNIVKQKEISLRVYLYLLKVDSYMYIPPEKEEAIFAKLTPQELMALSSKAEIGFVRKVFEHIPISNIPKKFIINLAKRNDSSIRQFLSDTYHTIPPEAMLNILKMDKGNNGYHLSNFASKKNLTPEIIERIIDSNDPYIIEKLALNQSIPKKYLYILADHKSNMVVNALAQNNALPSDIISKLLMKADKMMLISLSQSEGLSDEQARMMAQKAMDLESMNRRTQMPIIRGLVANKAVSEDIIDTLFDYMLNNKDYIQISKVKIVDRIMNRDNMTPEKVFDLVKKLLIDFDENPDILNWGNSAHYNIESVLKHRQNEKIISPEILLYIKEKANIARNGSLRGMAQRELEKRGQKVNESKVKISKSELRQIILEEVLKIMK